MNNYNKRRLFNNFVSNCFKVINLYLLIYDMESKFKGKIIYQVPKSVIVLI